MAELIDAVPRCALALYAHPDDADVAAGGTLARWAAAGTEVHVLACTRGEKGSLNRGDDPEAVAEVRRQEMEAGAGAIGARATYSLGHADGELDNDVSLRRELVELIRRVRPEIVFTSDPTAVFFGSTYYNHRDHRVIGYAALDAVAPAAWSPHYFPDTGPPHRVTEVWLSAALEPDVWVDIGDVIDIKTNAILCHVSQLGEAGEWMPDAVRQRAEDAGRQAGVRFAEGFRRLVFG